MSVVGKKNPAIIIFPSVIITVEALAIKNGIPDFTWDRILQKKISTLFSLFEAKF